MEFTSRQLRAFHLVAEHLSFARAAQALFITPSGLSVLVREFETQLGYRLFDRTTRRVQLTRQGSDLLDATRRRLDDLDDAMARVARSALGKRQVMTLGTTPMVAANVLPAALREYRRSRPELRVRVYDADQDAVLREVQSGRLDAGVGVFKTVRGVRRVPVFRFSLGVIRARRHRDATGPPVPWSALHGETVIALSATSPHQRIIDERLARAGARVETVSIANLLDTQMALVEADEGIAIVPSFGMAACRGRQVVMSLLVDPVVELELHQITQRGRSLPEGADLFLAFLRSYLSAWAAEAGVV
jgi:LysR family transcriptional regulator, carnitine catabolism transcriptional activator